MGKLIYLILISPLTMNSIHLFRLDNIYIPRSYGQIIAQRYCKNTFHKIQFDIGNTRTKENGLQNISPFHRDIIFSLLDNEKLTMKEISEKIDCKKNTVTALIEKLFNLGYIKKQICTNDKRVCYISLTKKGLELENLFIKISNELLIKTYSGLNIKNKENGLRFLTTIHQNISREVDLTP